MSPEHEQAPRFTVRDATEDDVKAILKMHAQSWLDTYPNDEAGVPREWVEAKVGKWDGEEKIEQRRELIRRSRNDHNLMYKVAENEKGEIIGIIAPHRDDTVQRVGAIYVDKAYQGTGLAQQLMSEILVWADQDRSLELEVAAYNGRAKAFYKKYGFEELENSEHLVHEMLPAVTMIRKGDAQ